jgi:DNA-binding NarL/FixJ family response regulator
MDLYVGAICAWYPHAEINQVPSIGIVLKIKNPGVLTMYRFPASGGIPTIVDNVHHVDSERLRENENIRIEYGGWGTLEELEKSRQEKLNPVKEAVVPVHSEEDEISPDEQIVLSCFNDGMNVDQIAEKMGRGWGPKKVGAILKEKLQTTA